MHANRRGRSLVRLALLLLLLLSAVALADHDDQTGTMPGQISLEISQEEAAPVEQGVEDEDDLSLGVVHQDEAAAFAQDANLMATQSGLPRGDVETALAFQNAFTLYGMEVLLPRYEDEISAIWVDPAPATRGHVRFVGDAPELARSEAFSRGLDVVFAEGGEISMAEHAQRSELVADVLVFNGYQNFICGPDHKTGRIEIEVRLPEDSPELHVEDLAVLVEEFVSKFGTQLDGRAAEIRPADFELTLVPGSGPLVVPD